MPQPVLNLLEGYAVGKQEGCAAMPEIVEAHFLHAVPLVFAVVIAEHSVVIPLFDL